jgi:hypothetical protein
MEMNLNIFTFWVGQILVLGCMVTIFLIAVMAMWAGIVDVFSWSVHVTKRAIARMKK